MCVFVPVSTALAGYTATHHAVHCLRIPSLNLEILYNLILYIIWSRVGGILSLVACVALIAVSLQSQSQCRSSTVTFTGSSAGNEELALGVTPDFQFQLAPFSLSLSLFLCRHCPGTCGLGRASPFRFRGRLHRSTWQDTHTTAANLGQISCRGMRAF